MDKKTSDSLAGKNSYKNIVSQIVDKIQKAQTTTLEGNEFLKQMYDKLNESTNITPLLSLRPFLTGAEKIASDDISFKEVIDFIKKSVTGNADLNFLIGLCKEEHFENLNRMNHPSPQSTIKDIEDQFNKPSSTIEEGIRAGLFDNLKSNLLNKIKTDIEIKPDKKLNESDVLFNGNLVKYSPIGIKFEDTKNNRMVVLTESFVLGYNRETNETTALNDVEIAGIDITPNYKRLLESIEQLAFNPEDNSFNLNENWDFNLKLNQSGSITIDGKDIPKEKIKDLLFESVMVYNNDPMKVKNFNKMKYLHDADNFVALCENHSKLIRFDNLQMIRNLNENTFILIDKNSTYNSNEPKILGDSSGRINKLFESYHQFVNETDIFLNGSNSNTMNGSIKPLFESHLKNEIELDSERQSKLTNLMEEQRNINQAINEVKNLKPLAEVDSPAMDKLNEQEKLLELKLNQNLEEINFYQNQFKLR
jgi:hypothetical protein